MRTAGWSTLWVVVLVSCSALAGGKGPKRAPARQGEPGPTELVEKMRTDEVKPFEVKLNALAGGQVKVTVDFTMLKTDPPAYLARTANNRQLSLGTLDPVLEAVTAIASDQLGRDALAQGLKVVDLTVFPPEPKLSFADGVLAIGNVVIGDSKAGYPAKAIREALEAKLLDPRSGVALPQRRAVEAIKPEVAAFQQKVNALCGAPVKVTVRTEQLEQHKQAPLIAENHRLSVFLFDPITGALSAIAADPGGQAFLQANLKEIVVGVVDSMLSFKGGVLTVESDPYGSGGSYDRGSIRKALQAAK